MSHNSESQQQRYMGESYEQQERFTRTNSYSQIETTSSYQQYQGHSQPLMYNNNMNSDSSPQRVVMPSQPSTPQPSNNSPQLDHPSSTPNDNENDTTNNYNATSPVPLEAQKFNNAASPYPNVKDRKDSLIHETCPSFGPTEYLHNIVSIDRHTTIDVRLHTKIDRGFFLADNDWTCYRRNYFQVSGSFSLEGVGILYEGQEIPCLAKDHTGHLEEIHCFMLGVKARLSDCDKSIQLIQHTPKRDKGPQTTPTPKLIRPGGNIGFSSVGSSQSIVTFERLQFKTATANNGKRRAAQQYYVIIIELLAKLRNGNVLTVASAKSAPLVVRGRSPGHYAESDSGTTRQHRHSNASTGGPMSSVIQQHHASHLPYHRPSLIHSSNSYSSTTSNGLFQPNTPTANHSSTTTPSNEYMPYDYHGVPSTYNYGHMSQPHSYPSPAIPMMQHHYLPDRSMPDAAYPNQNENHHDYDQQQQQQQQQQQVKVEQQPSHSSPYYWQRQEGRYEDQEYSNRMRIPSNQSTSSSMENGTPYRQQDASYYQPYGGHYSHQPMHQSLPAPNGDHYYQPPPQQQQQHYDWRSNKMPMYTYDSENRQQHEYERQPQQQQQQQSPTHSPVLNRETATIVK